jgi:hypothetical protein
VKSLLEDRTGPALGCADSGDGELETGSRSSPLRRPAAGAAAHNIGRVEAAATACGNGRLRSDVESGMRDRRRSAARRGNGLLEFRLRCRIFLCQCLSIMGS